MKKKKKMSSLGGFHFRRVTRGQGLVYEFYIKASKKVLKISRVKIIDNYKRNEYDLVNKE